VRRRGRLVAIESADGVIHLARRDSEPNFSALELHAARMVGGAQRFGSCELLVVCVGALQRGKAVADLLVDQHSGHQQYAERCPSGELGPNGGVQNRHRTRP